MFEDTFCRKGLNIIFLAEWKVSGIQGFGFGFPGTTRDTKLCASRAVINFELNVWSLGRYLLLPSLPAEQGSAGQRLMPQLGHGALDPICELIFEDVALCQRRRLGRPRRLPPFKRENETWMALNDFPNCANLNHLTRWIDVVGGGQRWMDGWTRRSFGGNMTLNTNYTTSWLYLLSSLSHVWADVEESIAKAWERQWQGEHWTWVDNECVS